MWSGEEKTVHGEMEIPLHHPNNDDLCPQGGHCQEAWKFLAADSAHQAINIYF